VFEDRVLKRIYAPKVDEVTYWEEEDEEKGVLSDKLQVSVYLVHAMLLNA
jgi:hypothetical protein